MTSRNSISQCEIETGGRKKSSTELNGVRLQNPGGGLAGGGQIRKQQFRIEREGSEGRVSQACGA